MKYLHFFSIALLTGMLVLSSPVRGQSIEQISQRIDATSKGIGRVEARAILSFGLTFGILPYRDSLEGSYIFRSPDQHELSFPTAPAYLSSLPKALRWDLPSLQKYEGKVKKATLDSGLAGYELSYRPREQGSKVDSILVFVDGAKWKIRRHLTHYKDGGKVDLGFKYRDLNGYQLLESVAGDINLRSYRIKGTANISLTDHKIFSSN